VAKNGHIRESFLGRKAGCANHSTSNLIRMKRPTNFDAPYSPRRRRTEIVQWHLLVCALIWPWLAHAAKFSSPSSLAIDSNGNLYVTDTNIHVIRKVSKEGYVSTLAGLAGTSGTSDGIGGAARFKWPSSICIDVLGFLYVADTENFTVRKISPSGSVSTIAGSPGSAGTSDGVGSVARFARPRGIAVDAAGNVYVSDYPNIRKITPGMVVSTIPKTYDTGPSSFSGLRIDAQGNVIVADGVGNAVMRLTPDGTWGRIGGSVFPGSSDSGVPGVRPGMRNPTDVAIDSSGNILVADSGNNSIRKISPDFSLTTFAGPNDALSYLAFGYGNGVGASGVFFSHPSGLEFDREGNLYVADSGNAIIRKITPGRVVTTFAGTPPGSDGTSGVEDDFPTIITEPQSVELAAGYKATFSVVATGLARLGYQWLKNGSPIAGATLSSLSIPSVSRADEGNYSVTCSNVVGSVSSRQATFVLVPDISAPTISTQPISKVAQVGTTVVLAVATTGFPQPSFQWLKFGAPIAGATTSTLILASVSKADAASYAIVVSNTAGSITSQLTSVLVTPSNSLSNLSIRTAATGGQVVTVGAVISGGIKTVLVRAAGPALNSFGLQGMSDPRLELYTTGTSPLAENDDWPSSLAPTFTSVGAFGFASGSKDAAISQALNGSFTVQAKGTGAGTVLVEAYDVTGGSTNRMINVSARNRVGTGSDILIAGFAISGTGTKQVLIRAVGPTLINFGVTGTLADPKLEIFDSNRRSIASNDNWSSDLSTTFTQVGAFPLPAGSRDATILTTLNAGSTYTVQVSGVNNGTGEALLEIYEVF